MFPSLKKWTWLELAHIQAMGVVMSRAPAVKFFRNHHSAKCVLFQAVFQCGSLRKNVFTGGISFHLQNLQMKGLITALIFTTGIFLPLILWNK